MVDVTSDLQCQQSLEEGRMPLATHSYPCERGWPVPRVAPRVVSDRTGLPLDWHLVRQVVHYHHLQREGQLL